MIKPFYQGKLDTFCAIYAVLNALRLLRGIQTVKARDILNEVLLSLAQTPEFFKDVLDQKTDYISLVDGMLLNLQKPWRIYIETPFQNPVGHDEFWSACSRWMGAKPGNESGRTMVFRFLRYLQTDKPPLNRHWTTLASISDTYLRLFDCSHEAEAILNIGKNSFVTSERDVTREKLLCICPESVRFIRLDA